MWLETILPYWYALCAYLAADVVYTVAQATRVTSKMKRMVTEMNYLLKN